MRLDLKAAPIPQAYGHPPGKQLLFSPLPFELMQKVAPPGKPKKGAPPGLSSGASGKGRKIR